ncbi:hypothetical protein [Pseudonocardia humida]|uniref:Short subunit dehydrogenase n=1 Tax=Pseudonocardia humida TaxID=2800819 RepID=A0ABT1A258_9PSEU|nr:hypothetical protein [Pseudonocardia humida]MCO1657091.1 hypothetical protein [Pseudonocardia humida]
MWPPPRAAPTWSKPADPLFATELDRRLRAAGADVISVAAHPGLTDTELLGNSVRRRSTRLAPLAGAVSLLISQPLRVGVLPQLYAATAPQVRGGDHVGPGAFGETRGHPGPARRSPQPLDVALAVRLRDATAAATGVAPDPA